jgi:hypothetical protein
MNSTKQQIYEKLSEIDDVSVYQIRPQSSLELPCIVFSLSDVSVDVDLDSEIYNQTEEYTIDIFAIKTSETSSLLVSIEEKMREMGYILQGALDIPDPDSISHLNATFRLF